MMMAAALSSPYNISKREPRYKDTKPLREYSWKGHTVMAYSKDDAKKRIKTQMMKGE